MQLHLAQLHLHETYDVGSKEQNPRMILSQPHEECNQRTMMSQQHTRDKLCKSTRISRSWSSTQLNLVSSRMVLNTRYTITIAVENPHSQTKSPLKQHCQLVLPITRRVHFVGE
jgi:hypothetical protein